MPSVTFKNRVMKKLGMKTQEEKVDDGLRALRDIADEIGEHDIAMEIDEVILNSPMQTKCEKMVFLAQAIPLLVLSKKIEEIIDELKKK